MNKPSISDFWTSVASLFASAIAAWYFQEYPILYGFVLVMAGVNFGGLLMKLRLEFLREREGACQ